MRLFVNTQHPYYQTVARNGNEAKFWLGVPNDVDDQTVGDSLGRKPGEVFFTSENLLETRRKIQLMFDSWSNPNIFADGLIKPDRAQEILRGLIDTSQAERIRAQSFNRAVSQPFNQLTSGNTVLGDIVGGAFGIVIGALAGIGNLLGLDRRAAIRAADSLAPWLHTIQDFPNVNTNIRKDGNKRSPKTLYDDRNAGFLGAGTRDFNDDEAILCGYLETLADALYGKTDYHPDKRGMVASKTKLQQFFVGLTRKNDPTATYAHGLIYIAKYLQLIDDILRFDDESLSRAIDLTEATIVSSPISIRLDTVKIALVDTLESAAEQVIKEKVYTYLDPLREYKILLNAGEDRQYVMESWRKAPSNPEAMQFKLINPLDRSINVNDSVYVSREIAKTVIDTIDFKLGPEVDITPYLRPRNTNVGEYAQQKEVRDVTLKTLGLLTGSQGVTSSQTVTYEDTIFRRWYTADFNSSELNMDFTNYANFVQYGSAYMRLNSFVNKLEKIESLTQQIKGSTVLDRQYAQEKENIIRNFDPYEQYLFYETASAYSASVFYVDGGREYNATGSWPRSGSTLLSTTSSVAISWFTTQSAIAERFDEFNQNQLTKHLPSHIQEDIESSEFLTFIDMFGHVMDNLKEYIDQFPNIYSTEIDPYKELTMDQVYEVATAFGLDLPNVYSLSTLQQYFASIYGEQGSRSLVAETWKRFLHAMMFIYKSKGTKTSLNAVLSTYGIRTPMLQIKETSYPTDDNYISSEELTYGLKFTSAATSSIRIPFVSSSVNTSTMTLRFLPTVKQSSSLLSGDDKWVVNLIPHPSASKDKYGRIEIVSGSNKVKIASSSYFRLYDTDYTLVALSSQSGNFTVLQADGDQLLYEYSSSTNLPTAVWATTTFAYIGGSGSIKLNSNFEGIVDEVRTWAEQISATNIINQAYDPGMSYGASYSSSYANLYVSLTFSQVSSSVTKSLDNEAAFYGASIITNVSASGFTTESYVRLSRNIKQFLPVVGATTYSNNKIKVAPPPVFNSLFVDEATNTVTLDPRKSIKLITDKIYTAGLNVVSFGVSPTDYVNQDIIRNMGTVSINTSLGNYRDLKDGKYDQLDKIFKYYLNNYYKKVDPNEFIDFYSNLAQAPAETAAWLIPARAKLLTGIVIESPLLSRKKLSLEREITVGGSNTKNLEFYSSGSMVDFGIYVGNTTINVTNQNIVLSTTPYYIDSASICKVELSDVTGSNNYYETTRSIDVGLAIVPQESRSYGYARYAYLDEVADKPLQPMYNVPPRSDLLDYGVTSYFHKQNGIYRFIVTTPYKEWFLAKLDISPYTAVDPAYSQITLVPTSSTAALPGRYSTTTGPKTISSLGTTTGLLNIANVFSLQAVYGPASGSLRIRLYANASLRDDPAEISRAYTTAPAPGIVLYDAQLNGNPDVTPPLLINVDRSTIYYRLDNRTASTLSTEVVLNYFAYEPIQSIPLGYLPRHYRFSRENVIALKRRNYLGCKAVTGERVSDPTGRFGFERPFFTTVADYESVDVFKRNLPPRTPTTPPAPTDRTPPQRGGPPAPTPSTGPSGRPRLTSLLGRIFNRNNGQR